MKTTFKRFATARADPDRDDPYGKSKRRVPIVSSGPQGGRRCLATIRKRGTVQFGLTLTRVRPQR